MILCVSGGREYKLTDKDKHALALLHERHNFRMLIHGDCRGADHDAAAWWRSLGLIEPQAFPPDLYRYGSPRAYHKRNEVMCILADVVVCFPGGRGTASTASYAEREVERRGILFYDWRKGVNWQQAGQLELL